MSRIEMVWRLLPLQMIGRNRNIGRINKTNIPAYKWENLYITKLFGRKMFCTLN